MHADSRPDAAETARPSEGDPRTGPGSIPALPILALSDLLRQLLRTLYITRPEPVRSYSYGPSYFLCIEDEVAGFAAPSFTLTHDPQPPLTRAAATVRDLARTNALIGSCFAVRNALDARIQYLRQMEELTTSRGASEHELEQIKRVLLAMAEGYLPHPAGKPRPEAAGPFTHTFGAAASDVRAAQIAPRKNSKTEALRQARAQHEDAEPTR